MATAAPLPQPMLARPGAIPTRGDWTFELKWDGFRAIVSTEEGAEAEAARGPGMSAAAERPAGSTRSPSRRATKELLAEGFTS